MKFPRNARIFRGRLDVAPFAAVFFLLVIFVMLASLVYTPGIPLELPMAGDLPGTDKPSIAVAIDANGRLYFENKLIDELEFRRRLRQEVTNAPEPLTLIVHLDKAVPAERFVHLASLAREAGISAAWLATLPRPVASPPPPQRP